MSIAMEQTRHSLQMNSEIQVLLG